MSVVQHLTEIPFDSNFGAILKAFADPSPDRMNLTIGAYRDDNERPVLFEAVKKAKKAIVNDENEFEEYLPLEGHIKFTYAARDLIYKDNLTALEYEALSKRMYSIHTQSATSALFMTLYLLATNVPEAKRVFASDLAWCNYAHISRFVGLEYGTYKYYDDKTRLYDFDGMISSLEQLRKGDIVILQACGHNPTGCDPSMEHWRKIRQVVEEKQLIPLIDLAYQGFVTGDLAQDSLPVCEFTRANCDVFVAQSFSKNMGIYSARLGVLHVQVAKGHEDNIPLLSNNLRMIARALGGGPTRHGAEIAYRILTTPDLYKEWQDQLKQVADRINTMRRLLRQGLEAANVPGSWEHVEKQRGMFAFLGIGPEVVHELEKRFHVYMMATGRISVAGLNTRNIQRFIDAMAQVLVPAPHLN